MFGGVGDTGWQMYSDSNGENALIVRTVLRYWHTLRHLRFVQFYGRVWFRIFCPRPSLAPAPALRNICGVWQLPARRQSSLISPRTFLFLGQLGDIDEVGWDGPKREKLWRYNQHYFDDLNAADSCSRRAWHTSLILDWVVSNPPGEGNGWEPYPTSLRIVNWVKWVLAGNDLSSECLHSLAVQVRFLRQRLEVHLLGNHLFANAKALIYAGLFFDGPEAKQWLDTGLCIVARELSEQVLPDGGHFERSTMYHALALEDVLDLCNVHACYLGSASSLDVGLVEKWRYSSSRMLSWLEAMVHPDGEISFFNDAAFGIACPYSILKDYADRLGIPWRRGGELASVSLPYSGYARLVTSDAVAFLDLAPVGPDYLPGHAHADTLSFELSVFGQRLLVNSGTSCYGLSAERLRQRGTAAHNSVLVAGQDSSEVWGGFRVARRAYPILPQVSIESLPLHASCSHDGYIRLEGKPIHHRCWEMGDGYLEVDDSLADSALPAQARFHFHPDVLLDASENANLGRAVFPDGQFVEWEVLDGCAHLEGTTWHPRFGESLTNQCLCLNLVRGSSKVRWVWR